MAGRAKRRFTFSDYSLQPGAYSLNELPAQMVLPESELKCGFLPQRRSG